MTTDDYEDAQPREEISPSVDEEPIRDQLFVMIPDRRVSEHALRSTVRHIVAQYPVGRVIVDLSSIPGITIADTLVKLEIPIDRTDTEPLSLDELGEYSASALSGVTHVDELVEACDRVVSGEPDFISHLPAYVVIFYAPPLPNVPEPHIGATSPVSALHEALRDNGRDHLAVYPPEMGLRTNDGRTYVLRSQIVASSAETRVYLEQLAKTQEQMIDERMAQIENDPQVQIFAEELADQAAAPDGPSSTRS